MPDYLLRSPGADDVIAKASVGLEFHGRRGLRSAFGIVDYTNRCREEFERLHATGVLLSSPSPKKKNKKRRRRS